VVWEASVSGEREKLPTTAGCELNFLKAQFRSASSASPIPFQHGVRLLLGMTHSTSLARKQRRSLACAIPTDTDTDTDTGTGTELATDNRQLTTTPYRCDVLQLNVRSDRMPNPVLTHHRLFTSRVAQGGNH
jgi:hypothetical protein